ncbi:MAG: type II toxin-antitoxin system VapC family toxin [Mediterranea sp.]|jgi:tRNA(fMet)-specific endonuclease VapC|nr:type II toxin-antitoxin system VapC family toxin [Mediterranea sp.]
MEATYLLDTNICVFLFRGKYDINKKIKEVGWKNCCISEVTIAELKYGVEYSPNREAKEKMLNDFMQEITIVPFSDAIDKYTEEKARLRKAGLLIDDFDLLIACTAVVNECILVTDNVKHMARVSGVQIENWIEPWR